MHTRGVLRATRAPLSTALSMLIAAGCALAPSADSTSSSPSASAPAPQSGGRQRLSGHVTSPMMRAPRIGRLDAETPMSLVVGLPLKDRAALMAAVERVSDPTSADYGHYLTPAEFADRFGASVEDYEKVAAWAESRGLEVTRHANRFVVEVRGRAADIESALHVRMHVAKRPDGSTFRTPDVEPSIDLDVPIDRISNLDDFVVPRSAEGGGSGGGGARRGADFRNAYASCTALDGGGQTIAVVTLGNEAFAQSDIDTYFTVQGLPVPPPVQSVPSKTAGGPQLETTLDLEMAQSMAPAAQVISFVGSLDSVLANIAARNDIKQVTSSWFTVVDTTAQGLIAQILMQGASFFQASGDDGGHSSSYAYSNGDFRLVPGVTNVGGTALTMKNNGAVYVSESAWSFSTGGVLFGLDASDPTRTTTISAPIPGYQQGLATAANQASATFRNMPDISAEASTIEIWINGARSAVGGTSGAAPLMAGFMALVNQWRSVNGMASVGAANPVLYQNPQRFNDITQGSNGLFTTTTGYDLVTGLGSPKCELIKQLSGGKVPPIVPPFTVSPTVVDLVPGTPIGVQVSTGGGWAYAPNTVFSVSGLPAGVIGTFGATQSVGGQNPWAFLFFSANLAVPRGTYTLTVSASSGNTTYSRIITLSVDTSCGTVTCASAGATCGTVADGCGGVLQCGGCGAGQFCSGGTCAACGTRTCASAGAQCGSISDGCGGTIKCGVCDPGMVCSATHACVERTCKGRWCSQ